MSFFADVFTRSKRSGATLAKNTREHRRFPNAAQKSHVSPRAFNHVSPEYCVIEAVAAIDALEELSFGQKL